MNGENQDSQTSESVATCGNDTSRHHCSNECGDTSIVATSSTVHVDMDWNTHRHSPASEYFVKWSIPYREGKSAKGKENEFELQLEQDYSFGPSVQDIARRSLAGGIASGVACCIFNPLDCLRVRWQVAHMAQGASSAWSPPAAQDTLLSYTRHIIQNEGLINGLWRPGLGTNILAMSLSSAIRFGGYEYVRDSLIKAFPSNDGLDQKSTFHMLAAGVLTGSVGYVAVTPFHYLKTRVQAERSMNFSAGTASQAATNSTLLGAGTANASGRISSCVIGGMKAIVKEGGIIGLWKGWIPLGARGSLFTAGQVIGYDGCKTYAKRHGMEDSPKLHVVASVTSSFFASLLSGPADIVMSKYMSTPSNPGDRPLTFFQSIHSVYQRGGIVAFWRGWPLNFARLTPAILTFSAVYEELRHQLGIGYLS